ncbi:MAG: hypothetical protein AB7P04_03770, partial [Bacteriovoracia bacterium]
MAGNIRILRTILRASGGRRNGPPEWHACGVEYTDRGAPVLSVGGTLPTASVKEAQEAWQELITTVHPHFGSSIGGQRPWDAYPTTVIPRLDPKISFADYERVILGMYPKSDKPIVQKINFFGRTEKIKLGTF